MSDTKKIGVCYASSDEFSIHTGISLLSLLDHNAKWVDTVYLLDYGILEDNRKRLTGICDQYDIPCVFVPSKDILVEIGQRTGIENFRNSYATYSRAFLDQLLPETVDKVLYIDSDTAVMGSIEALCSFDMTGKVLAGCANSGFYGIRRDRKDRNSDLDVLSGNNLYLQCGVVLYSLDNWRQENCYEMIMETCPKIKELRFADQTLINNSIPDRLFGVFSPKYNLTSHTFCKRISVKRLMAGGWYTKQEALDALNHTVIVHFCGAAMNRPWYTHCGSRYKSWYLTYKARSPWKDVPLIDRRVVQNIKGCRALTKDRLMLMSMRSNIYVVARVLRKISSRL